MIDVLIFSVVSTTLAASAITALAQYVININSSRITDRKIRSDRDREPSALPAPALSQEMRDEIEQNEAWWLRSFHALLLKSGAKVVARIHGMEFTEKRELPRGVGMKHGVSYTNVSYQQPDQVALEGCICSDCARVLSESSKSRRDVYDISPVELSFGNRQLVAEIQRAYGLVPDGIAGPQTIRAMQHGRPLRSMSVEALKLVTAFLEFSEKHSRPKALSGYGRDVDWEAEVVYWTALDRKSTRKRYA